MPPSEWNYYFKIVDAAFRSGLGAILYPNGISEVSAEKSVAAMKRTAEQYPGRIHVFKVVDTDLPNHDAYGKIVGVSQWKIFPKARSEEEIQAEEAWEEADHEEHGWPEGINPAVVEDFFGKTSEYKKKHLGGDPFILLHVLATRPDQHRKGVGALSMAWGCKKADELGIAAYLEGSPMGVGLYKKYGFDIVDEMNFDARKHGHHEPLTHMCMKRMPQQQRL